MSRESPLESSLTPAVMLGVAAVTASLTAGLVRSARRPSPEIRKHHALIAYLRDHLGGSDMALRVVHRLGSTYKNTEDGRLFRRLSKELEEDRAVVRLLLRRLGVSGRSIKRVVSSASGAALSLTAGGRPGDLSLLRTLEALSIGVQGKRCLWRSLRSLSGTAIDGVNFAELEAKALRQWEAIEDRRIALAGGTLSGMGLRAN